MSGFEDLHVTSALGAALEAMGWSADDAAAREAAPTAARGHNLVAVAPPTPAYAAPALAGMLSRLAGAPGRALLLCPPDELDEWGALVNALARGTELRVQVAHGSARALRRLRAETLDVLVTTPDMALDLLRRAALKVEGVTTIFLAWPESWDAGEVLPPLMQDLPKDAQRIIYTAAPDRVTDLVERYGRKALTVGTLPPEEPAPSPVGPVRTATVAWNRRAAALADLVELLDPTSLVVWTRDRSHDAAIARALPTSDPSIRVVTGDAPTAQYVVAYDLPTLDRLKQLLAAGEVILLAPASAEPYLARITTVRRPIRLPGLVEAVQDAAAARRTTIVQTIGAGRPEGALATLAPLFERYDPAAVAAALFELWTAAGSGAGSGASVGAPAAAATAPASGVQGTARVFVGIGKRDGVTANDFVAVLTKDLRVDRTLIGRIELRDAYSLVEVPAPEVERIATAMNGVTIRRKRISARVDRGPTKPGERTGGPGGGSGGGSRPMARDTERSRPRPR